MTSGNRSTGRILAAASLLTLPSSATSAEPCCVAQLCVDLTAAECDTQSGILGHCRIGEPCGAATCDPPSIQPIADVRAVKGGDDLLLSWSMDPAASLYNSRFVIDKRAVPTCATVGAPVPGSAPSTIAEAVHVGALLVGSDPLAFYCVEGGCRPPTGACCALGSCEDGKTESDCLGAYLGDGSTCPDPACPVADLTPCLVGGNVLYLDGDSGDYIHPGIDTVTAAGFFAVSNFPTTGIELSINPFSPSQGTWWRVELSTRNIPAPLAVGTYELAVRTGYEPPGRAGLSVSGDARSCTSLLGRFQIHDILMSGSTVLRFTATWVQHCEGRAEALRGCVHYEQ